jgi:hypothetical protein
MRDAKITQIYEGLTRSSGSSSRISCFVRTTVPLAIFFITFILVPGLCREQTVCKAPPS